MSSSLVPDCFACKHLIGINPSGGWVCHAFDRIPVDILARRVKHDTPRDGDRGIQFEPGEPELVSRQDGTQREEPRGAEVQPNLRAAGVMFVDDNGHVLLLRRSDTDEWAFPGGKLEDGESEEDAARRECWEEIGRHPGELRPWTHRIADGVDFTTFLTRAPEQFEPVLSDEHTDHRWERLGDLEGDSLDMVIGQADSGEKIEVIPETANNPRAAKLDQAVSYLDKALKSSKRWVRADAADFNETDHPRAGDGKFTSGGGSSGPASGDFVGTKGGRTFFVGRIEGGRAYPASGGRSVPLNELTIKHTKAEWEEKRRQQEEKTAPTQNKEPEAPKSPNVQKASETMTSAPELKQTVVQKPTVTSFASSATLPSNSKTFEVRVEQAKKDSKLSDSEFKTKYGVTISGDGKNKVKVKQAIAQLPSSVVDTLRFAGIRVVASSKPTAAGSHSHVAEYRMNSKTLVVPDVYYVRGSAQHTTDVVGVTTHELGHALDFVNDKKFQREFSATIKEESKNMSKFDREYASHLLSNDSEMFAEIFRLTYSGNGAFEKRQSSVEKLFPKSIAMMREKFGD